MHVPALIAKKRDGLSLSKDELHWFVSNLDEWSREQIGAFLMACQLKGLNDDETTALTLAMLDQGARLSPRANAVDKHSTGGVGDKMSLVLAPALHACGAVVPMLAGRGLAHTGGTIDKLESIPGFNTGLSLDEMNRNPCFISRQTEEIAPADAVLYAIRDVTATVPCIGLITASILSKKAAEGIHALVLDVKFGRAAFMQEEHAARKLATSMVRVGHELGLTVIAQLTDMNRPIGRWLGNSHEIVETVACLKGSGPSDTMELVTSQALALGYDIAEVINNGSALKCFKEMMVRQGVNRKVAEQLIDDPWSVLVRETTPYVVHATSSGVVMDLDALTIGEVLCEAGAGRSTPNQPVNHGVGIELHAKVGHSVTRGDPVLTLDGPANLPQELINTLSSAVHIGSVQSVPPSRVLETVTLDRT